MKPTNYGDYPDLSQVRKILVVIFKNIGDVVLASPVFNTLKKNLPEATIDALVNSGTDEVLMDNPNINHVHVLNRDALKSESGPFLKIIEELRLLRSIRSPRYNLSIVLSTGGRGKYLGYLSGAKIRVGIGSKKMSSVQKHLITIPVRQALANRHYIERNLDCLRKIGIFPDSKLKAPTFFEGESAKLRIKKLLTKAGITNDDPYIVIHPTSRWMFKCWPQEKVAKLIDSIQNKLKIPVVLTSGPDDSEKLYIKNVLSFAKNNVIDFSGILSLRELGALTRMAKLFIGVDSAPMHIASAVKTPIVASFGPTSEIDFGPWGKKHKVVTMNSYSCRPCHCDGCGGSKVSECLTNLKVSTVFTAVKKQLTG